MGYRKLSDGTWEQPAQAERRLVSRQIKNWIATGAMVVATAGAGLTGAYLLGTATTVDQDIKTDHDKVVMGLIALFAAAGSAVVGATVMVGRHSRDERSLEQVRFDLQRGAVVINGQAVDPEYLPENDKAQPKAQIFALRQPA